MESVSQIPRLQKLSLAGTKVSDAGIAALGTAGRLDGGARAAGAAGTDRAPVVDRPGPGAARRDRGGAPAGAGRDAVRGGPADVRACEPTCRVAGWGRPAASRRPRPGRPTAPRRRPWWSAPPTTCRHSPMLRTVPQRTARRAPNRNDLRRRRTVRSRNPSPGPRPHAPARPTTPLRLPQSPESPRIRGATLHPRNRRAAAPKRTSAGTAALAPPSSRAPTVVRPFRSPTTAWLVVISPAAPSGLHRSVPARSAARTAVTSSRPTSRRPGPLHWTPRPSAGSGRRSSRPPSSAAAAPVP